MIPWHHGFGQLRNTPHYLAPPCLSNYHSVQSLRTESSSPAFATKTAKQDSSDEHVYARGHLLHKDGMTQREEQQALLLNTVEPVVADKLWRAYHDRATAAGNDSTLREILTLRQRADIEEHAFAQIVRELRGHFDWKLIRNMHDPSASPSEIHIFRTWVSLLQHAEEIAQLNTDAHSAA